MNVHETLSWWLFLPVVGLFVGAAWLGLSWARKARRDYKAHPDEPNEIEKL